MADEQEVQGRHLAPTVRLLEEGRLLVMIDHRTDEEEARLTSIETELHDRLWCDRCKRGDARHCRKKAWRKRPTCPLMSLPDLIEEAERAR